MKHVLVIFAFLMISSTTQSQIDTTQLLNCALNQESFEKHLNANDSLLDLDHLKCFQYTSLHSQVSELEFLGHILLVESKVRLEDTFFGCSISIDRIDISDKKAKVKFTYYPTWKGSVSQIAGLEIQVRILLKFVDGHWETVKLNVDDINFDEVPPLPMEPETPNLNTILGKLEELYKPYKKTTANKK